MKRETCGLVLALAWLLSTPAGWTQGDRGVLFGTVTDHDGGILPGVTVTATSHERGTDKAIVTNANGLYRFPALEPGLYSLQVELAGFATYRHEGIGIRAGIQTRIDVTLEIAGITETVTVTGETPWVNSGYTFRAGTPPSRSRSRKSKASSTQVIDWVAPPSPQYFDTEAYDPITENPFQSVLDHPLSTFSIDVDRASYANTRRFLNAYQLPPKAAVRIEELINYFDYEHPEAPGPGSEAPFTVGFEQMPCPWKPAHRLVRIGLAGKEIDASERPDTNLVFLLDVSGSMAPENKLPLVKRSMKMLTAQLRASDSVAIAVYAGASGLVLDRTPGSRRDEILDALERLEAGGTTNGGEGIRLAYQLAEQGFIEGGVNRVILATDGDFNVGITNQGDLVRLIEENARKKIFLSVLGFGMGNYKDSALEKLADRGNGNYAYIDSFREARKVLVQEMSGTLVTIAKDVKIQAEFNPARVSAYRLIGYENRILAKEDFNDDRKDAGEIGAGHRVTALYELVPKGSPAELPEVDPLKYQQNLALTESARSKELLTVKLRYKEPEGETSKLLSFALEEDDRSQPSKDFRFASAVAAFGMLLRESPQRGELDWDDVQKLARSGMGEDSDGYRREFVELVDLAKEIRKLDRER
jgi:Ca-activated chloride channel family protein